MITFIEYIIEQQLNERFINLFTKEDKQKYVDQVWDMLQTSYKSIGGIKGSGFSSKQDMIDNIPFWKIGTKDGIPQAAIMYKDVGGRKSVAVGTNGSDKGKALLRDIIKNDFERSYGEKSSKLLAFVKKRFPDEVEKYTIPTDQVKKILPNKDIEAVDDKEYYRSIGKEKIKKRMIGTPGIPITR